MSQHAAGCSVVIFHICLTLSKLCITIKDTYLQHEHHSPLQSFSCALTLDIPTNTHFSIGMKNAWLYEHCHCFTNAALFPQQHKIHNYSHYKIWGCLVTGHLLLRATSAWEFWKRECHTSCMHNIHLRFKFWLQMATGYRNSAVNSS